MNKEIEYYEFRYKIPKYKIKPPLNFSKYYQIHKDEIIIDLQQETQQLKDNWNKLKEYIYNQIPTDKTVLTKHIKIFEVLDKMQEIEESDNK